MKWEEEKEIVLIIKMVHVGNLNVHIGIKISLVIVMEILINKTYQISKKVNENESIRNILWN